MTAIKAKRQKILVKDNSSFLLFALLLVAALFLLIAFGPFRPDKLGLLSKKQQKQTSEAALLPPEGGGTIPKPPCKFRFNNDTVTPPGYGDVDGDGYVTSKDALLVQRIAGGLSINVPVNESYTYEAADVNGTPRVKSGKGDVDSVDSLLILRYVSGMDNSFPACFNLRNLTLIVY